MPTVVGSHPQSSYGKTIYSVLERGETLVVPDITAIPTITPSELEQYRLVKVGAMIITPLIKQDRYVAALAVNDESPRSWKPGEIDLVKETAIRTWSAVERANAESALRRNQDLKYLTDFIA